MLYTILRPLAIIFFRIFYQFEYSGLKNIPKNKPIAWAPNHTNALVDPVIVAMTVPQKVRFYARGDVFKGRFVKWAMNSMNMSPMFRLQEGYGEIKKNNKSFEECRNLLAMNKSILIFPEAICIQQRRIQPLKKGLSRIVFQTEENFDFKKDVSVIPVGLNYSNPSQFRSKLFMEIGKPISILKYEEQYKLDKAKAINSFTKSLEQEMSKLTIVIKNPDNDELVSGIEKIFIHQWLKEHRKDEKSIRNQYHASKSIVEMVNYLDEHHPKLITSLKTKVGAYLKKMDKNKLRDHLLRPESINKMTIGTFIMEFLMLWIGIPFYAIGLSMNFPPYFFAKKLAIKKTKDIEFLASIYANLAMFFWIIYYALQVLAVALIFRNWMLLGIYSVLVPIMGYYVLRFYPVMKKIFGRWRLLRMVRKERHKVEELIHDRTTILEELHIAKEEYLAAKN